MYLAVVLIDYISTDGILTTYRITPSDGHGSVVIDRLRDIDIKFDSPDSINVGGARVYNASTCSIQIQRTKLRQFRVNESETAIHFYLEHMRIPVGSPRQGSGGFYNLVLPPNFKFTELHIVDPYDKTHPEVKQKRHYQYDTVWDTTCNTSLTTMRLSSRWESFLFMLLGKAKVFDPTRVSEYLDCRDSTCAVSNLLNYEIISPKVRKALAEDIADKSEWLELKPNIAGVGINLNAIIKDSIKAFQRRIKKKDKAS
jgi:hypothetical protein